MDTADEVGYRKAEGHETWEVLLGESVIGTVRRFVMGAGQFGERWQATAPDGRQSGPLTSRRAAADWLTQGPGSVNRAGSTERQGRVR
jgi:hypothetical protein